MSSSSCDLLLRHVWLANEQEEFTLASLERYQSVKSFLSFPFFIKVTFYSWKALF